MCRLLVLCSSPQLDSAGIPIALLQSLSSCVARRPAATAVQSPSRRFQSISVQLANPRSRRLMSHAARWRSGDVTPWHCVPPSLLRSAAQRSWHRVTSLLNEREQQITAAVSTTCVVILVGSILLDSQSDESVRTDTYIRLTYTGYECVRRLSALDRLPKNSGLGPPTPWVEFSKADQLTRSTSSRALTLEKPGITLEAVFSWIDRQTNGIDRFCVGCRSSVIRRSTIWDVFSYVRTQIHSFSLERQQAWMITATGTRWLGKFKCQPVTTSDGIIIIPMVWANVVLAVRLNNLSSSTSSVPAAASSAAALFGGDSYVTGQWIINDRLISSWNCSGQSSSCVVPRVLCLFSEWTSATCL